jgi:hypothetical protein
MWRPAGVCAILVFAGLGGLIAGAMLVAWCNDKALAGTSWGKNSVAEVTLLRTDGVWKAEHVGQLGSNPNLDPEDPERKAVLYFISGREWGRFEQPWYGEWRVSSTGVSEIGTVSRRAVSDAIRAGAWPWPRGMIDADTGITWRPVLQFRSGFARAPWLLIVPFIAAVLCQRVLARAARNFGPGRCRRCGYDMRGLPSGGACPECAAVVARA